MSKNSDFDTTAKNYDAVFTYSNIGKAQRERVYKFLDNYVHEKPLEILEINCGTGEDSLYLSKKGHSITATDISEEMIKVARQKNKGTDVTILQLDINKLNENAFSKKFDVIFSNFGGLNCLSPTQFEAFISTAESLLKPKGKLILVVMPRHTLWERLYYGLKGNSKEANRRKGDNPVKVNVEGTLVTTWYYDPQTIETMAKNKFDLLEVKPVGFFIPPSYLEPFFSNKLGFLNLLIAMDALFISSLLAKYSDHFLIALEKK